MLTANLDAIISLGQIATEMNFVKPEVVEQNIIVIKNGRHPLQELTVDTFISNDTFISPDKNIALITGPNNSGLDILYFVISHNFYFPFFHHSKSVFVKQVGVLVYLAHIGSYVPCERAIVGLTDRILTRIATVETAMSPLSSFSADLVQVSRMMNCATERTLCLLDEVSSKTIMALEPLRHYNFA